MGRLRPGHCIRTKKRFRRLPPERRAERNRPECDRKADPLGYNGLPPLSARAGTGAVGIEEATMHTTIPTFIGFTKTPWNKGRLIGQKRPLKPKEVWAIRVRLQLEGRKRDLALFNLAIDSKLRGCDLVSLQVDDVSVGGRVRDRATVIQKKTGRPVQFEITEQTRSSIRDWLSDGNLKNGRLPIPEPPSRAVAPFDTPIRPHRTCLGRERRARQLGLRHPLDAPDEGGTDLSKNRQSASRPAACSGIQSWRAPFAISGSRSTTLSASPSRSNSD